MVWSTEHQQFLGTSSLLQTLLLLSWLLLLKSLLSGESCWRQISSVSCLEHSDTSQECWDSSVTLSKRPRSRHEPTHLQMKHSLEVEEAPDLSKQLQLSQSTCPHDYCRWWRFLLIDWLLQTGCFSFQYYHLYAILLVYLITLWLFPKSEWGYLPMLAFMR